MIFFFESGQLGNQIFQYVFLKRISRKNERIVFFGFDELFEVFSGIKYTHISKKNRYTSYIIFGLLKRIFYFFSNIKIFRTVMQNEQIISNEICRVDGYKVHRGLLNNVSFVREGYFQNIDYANREIVDSLHIKQHYINKAAEIIAGIPANYKKIFVHIRRGDYSKFTVHGKVGTELPIEYYNECISIIQEKHENVYFYFLSNDRNYVIENFVSIEKKIVSDNNYMVDFALMTLCDGGIISSSTFSFWGAYFMYCNKGSLDIYGPKYWLGFGSKEWFPDGVEANFISYIDCQ